MGQVNKFLVGVKDEEKIPRGIGVLSTIGASSDSHGEMGPDRSICSFKGILKLYPGHFTLAMHVLLLHGILSIQGGEYRASTHWPSVHVTCSSLWRFGPDRSVLDETVIELSGPI